MTGDRGLLLRQADRALGLTRALNDPRRKKSCSRSRHSLLRRRIYGLCQGYEDVNDHDELRSDPALQAAFKKTSRRR